MPKVDISPARARPPSLLPLHIAWSSARNLGNGRASSAPLASPAKRERPRSVCRCAGEGAGRRNQHPHPFDSACAARVLLSLSPWGERGGRGGPLAPPLACGCVPPLASTPLARRVPPLLDPLPRWGRGIRKRKRTPHLCHSGARPPSLLPLHIAWSSARNPGNERASSAPLASPAKRERPRSVCRCAGEGVDAVRLAAWPRHAMAWRVRGIPDCAAGIDAKPCGPSRGSDVTLARGRVRA